jgi:hypothetical protein
VTKLSKIFTKNAIKSVLYFVRTCVKYVCARVLRVLDFFCFLLLIAHFSVIGVSSFEFAVADDETRDNFATPRECRGERGERRGYESI